MAEAVRPVTAAGPELPDLSFELVRQARHSRGRLAVPQGLREATVPLHPFTNRSNMISHAKQDLHSRSDAAPAGSYSKSGLLPAAKQPANGLANR